MPSGTSSIIVGGGFQPTAPVTVGRWLVVVSTTPPAASDSIGQQSPTGLSFAIGVNASYNANNDSGAIAMGWGAQAFGDPAVPATGAGIAIGKNAKAGQTNPFGTGAVAIGAEAEVRGTNSVAVGFNAKNFGATAISIGPNAGGTGSQGISIGSLARAERSGTICIGNSAIMTTVAQANILIGQNTQSYDGKTLVIGSDANATVVGAGVGSGVSCVGTESRVQGGIGAIALGYKATVQASGFAPTPAGAVAIGGAEATVGVNGAIANAPAAIAIGTAAIVQNTGDTYGIAIGRTATVNNASHGIAIGQASSVGAPDAIALGSAATVGATFTNSIALGNGASANAANQLSIPTELRLQSPGRSLRLNATGTAAKFGIVTLVAGTATVNTTAVVGPPTQQIWTSSINPNAGTPGFLRVDNYVAGVSFDIISSDVADTSDVSWWITDNA